ncbi:hypothetical protein [uncultured Lacinutrix sp.]|uniref:hypothetical protein n=1 Tax=uncultured Lacinutrix sp. TaxID=574032 RepID=UPI00261C3949|nr:hypothetical protein [uncultured Lacinutrix sp.]
MENPFKKILQSEKISIDVKSKVMGDVERLKLVIDIADLFMIKHPSTLNDILKTAKGKNK